MMRNLTGFFTSTILCMMLINNLFAQKEKSFLKEFEAKSECKIETVSGDCTIETGATDKIIVKVVYSVQPADAFKPVIKERSNSIRIKEKWQGGTSSGNVSWTITLPADTKVEFSTASGDLSVEGLTNSIEANTASGSIQIGSSKGEFDINTASGEIDADNINGEIKLNTASGDINIKKSEGEFDLNCASGDIDVKLIKVKVASNFSTASGDIEVVLAATPDDDCELSAASGNVSLDYNGNKIKGYVELSARKHRGKIRSDVTFDKEEEYERGNRTYIRKSIGKKSDLPEILMSTASGRVTLKK